MPAQRIPINEHVRPQRFRQDARDSEVLLPVGPLGDPPEWFGPIALEEWDRLTRQLAHVLSLAHRGAMIALCALTEREVKDLRGETGMRASDANRLHSLRMQFAVMPASQTKVRLPGQKKQGSKWEGLKPTDTSKTA